MTYNVFGGTLNLAQSINLFLIFHSVSHAVISSHLYFNTLLYFLYIFVHLSSSHVGLAQSCYSVIGDKPFL